MDNEPNRDRQSDTSAPRIVMQYFRGNILVCELKTAGQSLSLHISRDDGDENRDAGWRIEAHAKNISDGVVVAASGPTRRAVLAEVGSLWRTRSPELGLYLVDWDAVAAALTTVRAIE